MLEFFKIILYYPFVNLLTFFTGIVPGHYAAIGIILLTLLVRFILIIPSKRAAQSQRKMNEMQPLIEELKKEYGDDKQGLATAQMDLYKKNNINPFASCLPTLIQLPLLIVLYRAIIYGFGDSSAPLYFWVPRLSDVNALFFGIDLLKPDHFFILPIIASALQFVQIRMTMPKTPAPKPGEQQDPTAALQRNMMFISPLITLSIAYRLPAGAALYWIISTGFSVVQQYLVNQENLKLTGVKESIENMERVHPERKQQAEKVLKEMAPFEEKSSKGGVSVTVRRKKE